MADNSVVAERPCHECGQITRRDVRDFTITYQDFSSTFLMPGWYCTGQDCEEAIANSDDMKASSRELHILKAKAANLLAAKAISNLLRVLEAHPAALEVLRRESRAADTL